MPAATAARANRRDVERHRRTGRRQAQVFFVALRRRLRRRRSGRARLRCEGGSRCHALARPDRTCFRASARIDFGLARDVRCAAAGCGHRTDRHPVVLAGGGSCVDGDLDLSVDAGALAGFLILVLFFVTGPWLLLHGAEGFLNSSSRRKPGPICFRSAVWVVDASRGPTHVPVRFRPPSWRTCHFLLLVQEKVTKENTPSVSRRRCATVCCGRPGFCRQSIHGLRRMRRDPSRRPRASAGLIRPPFAAAQRDPSQKKKPDVHQ